MRYLLFLCPLVFLSGQITLSPQTPSAVAGKSITLTSNTPVEWHLNGVGSLSNATSTSVTYTAPAGVVAKNQMLGCPVGPNDSIFNTRIDGLPVDSRSNAWIGGSTSDPTNFEKDNWGISIADAATPTRTLRTYYSGVTLPNFVMPPPGPNLKRQQGDYEGTFGYVNPPDHHVMTVRHTDCTFYESYDDYLAGYTRACRDGSPGCNVQSAVTYSAMDYSVPGPDGGTNAAMLPLAPAIWQLAEIESGSIHHATTFTTNAGSVAFNKYSWPAAGAGGGCDQATCPNAMPLGTRLRLKSWFNTGSVCNSGIPAEDTACNTMLSGLKEYGMILADTGTANAVQLSLELSEDPAVLAAMQMLISARIPFTDFEAVDESSLEVNASSYQVCPLNTACLNGVNYYEAPSNQAIVTATALNGKAAVSTPIAIQAIGIGLGVPPLVAIAAGNYSFPIPAWVHGTTNQTIHWKLISGVGSVSDEGAYTPPSSTGGPGVTQSAVLQGVSAADSASTVTLRLMVIPAASNGAVRIDTGSPISNTDSNGNVWAADIGMDGGAVAIPNDYPHWNKSSPAATIVYESQQRGKADIGNTIIVPNGTYDLHLLFGLPADGSCSPCSSWLLPGLWDQYTFAPYLLEVQGQLANGDYNFASAVNYMFQTPTDVYLPAVVTNNLLQIYVRGVLSDQPPYYPPTSADTNKYALLNGIEITPTSTASVVPPSWSINTNGQNSIAIGQTLNPFTLVTKGGAPNDPQWSITSGPAGASLKASQLSLSSTATPNGQPIVVHASDGTYSASVSIATPAAAKTGFNYSRKLTISPKSVGSTSLENFPILVAISDKTLAATSVGGHVANRNGYDIIFASDSKGQNLLPWEVESYNDLTGTFVAHVMMPTLSHTASTVFYMFYGNSSIISQQVKPTLVWTNNYTGVYHFEGPELSIFDSSGQGDSAYNSTLSYATNGRIAGGGAAFSSTASLPPGMLDRKSGTFEAWVSTALINNRSASWVVLSQSGATGNDFFRLGWNGNLDSFQAVWSSQSAGSSEVQFKSALTKSQVQLWNHVVYTWDSSDNAQYLYWNGLLVGSSSSKIPILSSSTALQLGSSSPAPSYSMEGLLDEVRFSSSVRSGDWVAAEYASQSAPSTFVSVGAEVHNN